MENDGEKLDLESLRLRIASMNEFALMRFARTAAMLHAASPTESSRVRMEEARLEWKRREHKAGRQRPNSNLRTLKVVSPISRRAVADATDD